MVFVRGSKRCDKSNLSVQNRNWVSFGQNLSYVRHSCIAEMVLGVLEKPDLQGIQYILAIFANWEHDVQSWWS